MATLVPLAALPGPRNIPLVGWRGNFVQFARDSIGYMERFHRQYGELAGFASGVNLVFTFNPIYTRQILTDPELFYSNPFLPAPVGTAFQRLTSGVLSTNGAVHRRQRRMLMPAFHRKQVASYADDMTALTSDVLDSLRPGQHVNIAQTMRTLTLRIAAKALFDLDAAAEEARFATLIHCWLHAHESAFSHMLPYDRPGLPFHTLLRTSEQLDQLFREQIAHKRAQPAERNDVLSMLLAMRDENGEALSDDEIIGQVSILFIAGHETSSNALTWTLFLLAQHPHVAADLLDELDSVLHGAPPTLHQLAQLPLLERVIKESMRVLPPVPFSFRWSTGPFAMGPYEFTKDTGVFFSQYMTHHDPRLYATPERFLPERWETIDPSPYEYFPFSTGPRMCIGATFAMMEMKIALAMMLQRYRFALVPNTTIDRNVKITMSPRGGMPVRVFAQDRAFGRSRADVRGNIREMVELA